MKHRINQIEKVKQCNRCGKSVVWVESRNGKFYLVNEQVEITESGRILFYDTTDFHSATCKPQRVASETKPKTNPIETLQEMRRTATAEIRNLEIKASKTESTQEFENAQESIANLYKMIRDIDSALATGRY